jgi:heptosyltransferase III
LLFLKPLGTFFTMLSKYFCVNDFVNSCPAFQQYLVRYVFMTIAKHDGAMPVHKTGARKDVSAILNMVRRLVIRPGALGDFIVSLPALECLRAEYLEVWTAAAHVPLIRFADRTRAIASTGLDRIAVTEAPAGLWDTLASFDSIVSWYGANRLEFRDAVRHLPFTFFPALPDGNTHAVDFYLSQARTLSPCPDVPVVPRIACPGRREDFIVIHPFSGSPRKNWPLEKFRALAEQLSETAPIYWCRGPEDPALPGAVEIENLYELACWLAKAQLYTGNDSGITHLAAAAGTPVLAFFGPTDPAIWAPRGPQVQIGRFDAIF